MPQLTLDEAQRVITLDAAMRIPLRELDMAELDAARMVIGEAKRVIRCEWYPMLSACLHLLSPYTDRIEEINQESFRDREK